MQSESRSVGWRMRVKKEVNKGRRGKRKERRKDISKESMEETKRAENNITKARDEKQRRY